jgi:hypothetical protein
LEDGSTISSAGVIESALCLKNWDPTEGCNPSECNGCCRIYNYAVCDTDNEFTHLQCACSNNTSPHPPKVIDIASNNNNTSKADDTDNEDGTVDVIGTGEVEVEEFDCIPEWSGYGTHPIDPDRTPAGMEPGDCRSSDHCGGEGQENVCCKYPVQGYQTHISSILHLLTYFDTFQFLGFKALCICRMKGSGSGTECL